MCGGGGGNVVYMNGISCKASPKKNLTSPPAFHVFTALAGKGSERSVFFSNAFEAFAFSFCMRDSVS